MELAPMESSEHGPIEAFLAAQRTLMETWGEPLEQMLSVGVYMIPVQDDEDDKAGFASQAVYSAIDLFNLYRTLVLRRPEELPVCEHGGSEIVVSPASADLRRRRLIYTSVAFLLRALRSVQVLLEMYVTRRSGPDRALRLCIKIETLKLVLKMLLKSQAPFSLYVDEDAIEDAEPPKLTEQQRQMLSAGASNTANTTFVGRRSGKTLQALQADGSAATAPIPPPRVAAGLRLASTQASQKLALAETLHHSRPLLQLFFILRRGRKSWAAWLLAYLMDRASLTLLQSVVKPQPGTRAAALELAEVRRRSNLMWWSLARSPVFDRFLQGPCETLDRLMNKIPVLNLFNVVELFLVLQPFYFSTSGS